MLAYASQHEQRKPGISMTIDEGLALLRAAKDQLGGDTELRLITQNANIGQSEALGVVAVEQNEFDQRFCPAPSVCYIVEGEVAEPIQKPDFVADASRLSEISWGK